MKTEFKKKFVSNIALQSYVYFYLQFLHFVVMTTILIECAVTYVLRSLNIILLYITVIKPKPNNILLLSFGIMVHA